MIQTLTVFLKAFVWSLGTIAAGIVLLVSIAFLGLFVEGYLPTEVAGVITALVGMAALVAFGWTVADALERD